jgi:hypothetical protein
MYSFKKCQLLILNLILVTSVFAKNGDNSNIPPKPVKAPVIEELGLFTDSAIMKLAKQFQNETKRRPAGTSSVASSDLMSKEYKQFVNEVVNLKTGEEFYKLLVKYDGMYNTIPSSANDLKFTVARLATWLPLKAFIWRMTPMVHQILPAQTALLTTLYNVSEQVKINFNNTHVEAQMLFLTVPSASDLSTEFRTESDFTAHLGTKIYKSIATAVSRLEALQMQNITNGKETPIVIDAKIRFGRDAFGEYADDYNNYDRFKVAGEAERFAAIARLYRRLYTISIMNAYNWNGHLALRKDIGRMYGMGVAESALWDKLPGEDNVFIKGVTRNQRITTIKKYPKLYTKTLYGDDWMKVAYFNLHKSGLYLSNTWDNIKNADHQYIAQLDPEVFMDRKEQVEAGMVNIKKLTSVCNANANANRCDPTASGKTSITGTINSDIVVVDLKGFYDRPPMDLKSLLPTNFAKNEDILALKAAPGYTTIAEKSANKSDLIEVNFNGKKTTFRNYLFGRAVAWDSSPAGYGVLFPELKNGADVANAMKILNQTRGAKIVTNGLTMFVR